MFTVRKKLPDKWYRMFEETGHMIQTHAGGHTDATVAAPMTENP
jgi:hypothetical protein